MNSNSVMTSSDDNKVALEGLLESARPFLRGELESVDKKLPSLVGVLRSVGAGECWHKHGSFLDHLVDMYRILKLWNAPDCVCLLGLFHSAYSNSYVNLAIFDPNTGRDVVRRHVGAPAERLIHLFCVVPRHSIIHDDLLFRYTDAELVSHLHLPDDDDAWRRKLCSVLPAQGITVKHIKTGEDVHLSRRVMAIFLLMTMADFSDQLFGFQDALFDNSNGRLHFSGNNSAAALWPGNGKPGLWLNSISRMGALYSLISREEELFIKEREREREYDRDEDIDLVIPPVFEHCTRVVDPEEQIAATELYWRGVSNNKELKGAEEVLVKCIEKKACVGEPHVVLAQVYVAQGRYQEAEREAERGLKLLLEWGCPWDKRMSWEGWVAWCRVLLMKAREKSWPDTSMGILNLGLVK